MKTPLRLLAVFSLAVLAVRAESRAAGTPKAPPPSGFALIPAGKFMMGDALNEDKGAPQHKVNVSAFLMQKNLVTKAQWDEVRVWALKHGYPDLPEGKGKGANHPVQTVSWFAVVKWCNARSEKEGLAPCYHTDVANTKVYRTGNKDLSNEMVKWNATGFRLPTEAEWEKAARGGLVGKRFPWGDTISHRRANFNNSGKETYQTGSTDLHPDYEKGENGDLTFTSPVGSFAPNGYGLYDMAGNVWEWCWDRKGKYPAALETDPHGAVSTSQRVCRGGCFFFTALACRVDSRYDSQQASADDFTGFRPVRAPAP